MDCLSIFSLSCICFCLYFVCPVSAFYLIMNAFCCLSSDFCFCVCHLSVIYYLLVFLCLHVCLLSVFVYIGICSDICLLFGDLCRFLFISVCLSFFELYCLRSVRLSFICLSVYLFENLFACLVQVLLSAFMSVIFLPYCKSVFLIGVALP